MQVLMSLATNIAHEQRVGGPVSSVDRASSYLPTCLRAQEQCIDRAVYTYQLNGNHAPLGESSGNGGNDSICHRLGRVAVIISVINARNLIVQMKIRMDNVCPDI